MLTTTLIIMQEITSSTTELTFFKGIVGAIIRELEKLSGLSFRGDMEDLNYNFE